MIHAENIFIISPILNASMHVFKFRKFVGNCKRPMWFFFFFPFALFSLESERAVKSIDPDANVSGMM